MMRIGIFGGTFDPVHHGHLILAEQCREQAQLDQVWFLPAARPPHKQDQDLAAFHHRVEMLTLGIAGHPPFRIEELEKERSGPSFTADTLVELHRRDPQHEYFLVVGSDCLPDMPRWYQPARILSLATLVVAERPGWPAWTTEQLRSAIGLPPEAPCGLIPVDMPLFELASRELRRRIVEGRSIRFLVPRAVECYIEQHRLYR